VDNMVEELEFRFPLKDLEGVAALENLLVKAAKGERFDQHRDAALLYLDKDVKPADFLEEVVTLKSLRFSGETFSELVAFLQQDIARASPFPAVLKAIKLLLTIPVTSATAERSFSVLRRIKTWDRASMSQEYLNSLSVLFVHKPDLDVKEVAKAFITEQEERMRYFGW